MRWMLLLVAAMVWLVDSHIGEPICAAEQEPVGPGKLSTKQVKMAVARLEPLADQTLLKTGVPGIAIAVVHGDDVLLCRGFGVREAGKPELIDADTVFQLASVSKPMSSTILAALVGQGRIRWDDRVIDHDPGFEMYLPFVTRELRLRDLLCHRSGLPDHAGDLLEDLGFSREQILFRLPYQPPDSSFRAGYAYTNFGYSEAAFAAAKAVDMPWEEVAERWLFKPAGMKSTSYRFADYQRATNRALLHVQVDGKWTAKNTRQPDAQAPAGGASSTLNDLVRWMKLQLQGGRLDGQQLVSSEALSETHMPQMVTSFAPQEGRLVSYALGWNVSVERGGNVFWKHSGGFSLGMRTEVAFLPSEQLAIAVLSNAGPTGLPEGLTESFFDFALDGKLQRDWVEFANRMFALEVEKELGGQHDYSKRPTNPSKPLELSAYLGSFANDFFGPIEVAQADGKLTLRMGPRGDTFPLTHWDRDTFTYQSQGEMAGGPSGVRFSIDADGKAAQVQVENLNIHGQGTFERRD